MRHFARALRSGWAFCWRAPRAADCSPSLERKTEKFGHIFFRARRRPGTKAGACDIEGLFKADSKNHGTPAIGGQGIALRKSQIAGVYLKRDFLITPLQGGRPERPGPFVS